MLGNLHHQLSAVQVPAIYDEAETNEPQYATSGSAGLDLSAVIEEDQGILILSGEVTTIRTGLRLAIPTGFAGFIYPRSGLGRRGLVLANTVGVIDSDYRGEVMVAVWNRSDEPLRIIHGDRIAQLVIQPVVHAVFDFVEDFDHQTERGDGGFGSTGGSRVLETA